MSKAAQLESQLVAERAKYAAAEARWVAQYSSLAQNNQALARTNNRLNSELDRTKTECDRLRHALAGHTAMMKSKITEQDARIQSLSQEVAAVLGLLKEADAEKEGLHAQLYAEQEVTTYLEWRLAQLQSLLDNHSKLQYGVPSSPCWEGPLPPASVQDVSSPTCDSFEVLADSSPAGSQTAQQHQSHVSQSDVSRRKKVLQPLSVPCSDAISTPTSNRSLGGEDPSVDAASIASCPQGQPRQQAEVHSIASSMTRQSTVSMQQSDEEQPSMLPAHKSSVSLQGDEDEDARDEAKDPLTPTQQIVHNNSPNSSQMETGGILRSAPRTSRRIRVPVSYAMPSVNSKLRQGDAFTFGDVSALGAKSNKAKSRSKSHSRLSIRGPAAKEPLDSVAENSA